MKIQEPFIQSLNQPCIPSWQLTTTLCSAHTCVLCIGFFLVLYLKQVLMIYSHIHNNIYTQNCGFCLRRALYCDVTWYVVAAHSSQCPPSYPHLLATTLVRSTHICFRFLSKPPAWSWVGVVGGAGQDVLGSCQLLLSIYFECLNVGTSHPVCRYVTPLRAGRLLDSPRHAARFVSLIPLERRSSIGSSGGTSESWTRPHSFITLKKGVRRPYH